MTKNHGNTNKNDKQYEGLRKKGMSKERAAKISATHPVPENAAVRTVIDQSRL